MARRLSVEQVATLAALDRPVVTKVGGTQVVRNWAEADVTMRSDAAGTVIFKRFTDLDGEGLFLYDAVGDAISTVNDVEWRILDSADWDPAALQRELPDVDPRALDTALTRLRARLTTTTEPGWVFPNLVRDYAAVPKNLIRTLVLNPTEQCNLRCTYCYYSGGYLDTREHNNSKASEDDVRAAVDLFLSHHEDAGGAYRSIYFFGGEPLLNFPLIEYTVRYFESRARALDLDVSNVILQINSNGLLLTDERVRFLEEHGVQLNISVDGPNHDQHRVDARGTGSLHAVQRKVEWLATEFPGYFRTRVGVICVVSPPVDIEALYEFFATWWPTRQVFNLSFDLILGGGDVTYESIEELSALKLRLWREFAKVHRLPAEDRERSLVALYTNGFNFLHWAFHSALTRDAQRSPGPRPPSLIGLRGIPGVFVALLGNNGALYSTYEFQSDPFVVGNATSGLDERAVSDRLADFQDVVKNTNCRTCWAAKLCNLDYPNLPFHADDDAEATRVKMRDKQTACAAQRADLAQALGTVETIKARYGANALEPDRQAWQTEVVAGNRPDVFTQLAELDA